MRNETMRDYCQLLRLSAPGNTARAVGADTEIQDEVISGGQKNKAHTHTMVHLTAVIPEMFRWPIWSKDLLGGSCVFHFASVSRPSRNNIHRWTERESEGEPRNNEERLPDTASALVPPFLEQMSKR